MKRSDAIREIKSIIATCGPTQPTIDTAKQVLDRLEKLGMMPPYKDGEEPFGHNEGYIVAPRWESEDEKIQ